MTREELMAGLRAVMIDAPTVRAVKEVIAELDAERALADQLAAALSGLGNAYRGDWSEFDGRTLRTQLVELAAALMSGAAFDAKRWLAQQGVCPETNSWGEYCRDRVPLPKDHPARNRGYVNYGGNRCTHIAAYEEAAK